MVAPLAQYPAVALRTGSGFLESLRDGREIWLEGERVKDVTAHPRLRGAAATIAGLYALQHQPDLRERLTFALDGSGERIGYSHIQPLAFPARHRGGQAVRRDLLRPDWP